MRRKNVKLDEHLMGVLCDIEQAVKLALGSENPEHWEAGLYDILDIIRSNKLEQAA